jgi:4-diphosphocytidyl-2-C-methyl-D-erythritol kinase
MEAAAQGTRVVARAPAKVNLALCVGPLRDDGFHDLATVYHAVDLWDDVEATAGPAGSGIRVTVEGEGAGVVPADESNLAWQAADLVAEALGVAPDVALHLRKSIPVAGGMAGGSADGAAALVACDALWSGGLGRDDFLALAAALGSDVPFSYHGGTALGTGRGDRLTSVLARGRFAWVFAVADVGLSTPEVYRECDLLRGGSDVPPPEVPEDLMAALRSGDAQVLGASLVNDLQPAALSLRPSLRRVLETGEEHGALGGIVSGSGPTCAFLARDGEHAVDLAVSLSSSGTCRTVRTAGGPAQGARVVETSAAG